jgi:hypothetical protein
MHALLGAAPNLQKFAISGPAIPASICLLTSCTALKDIHIFERQAIDQAAFEVLSSLPRLLALNVVFPDSPLDNSRSAGFPALEKLKITANLDAVAHFIAGIHSSNLTEITILSSQTEVRMNLHDFQGAATLWRMCMKALAANVHSRHSVRRISGMTNKRTLEHSNNVHAMLVLEPVLALPQIEELHLGGATFSGMYLNDGDVDAIASAWPNIRTLQLPTVYRPATCPTFASLQSLSLRCAQLSALEIPVDLHVLPSQANLCLSSHGLNSLVLINPSYKNTFDVAQLLDCLFPELRVYREHGPQISKATDIQKMLKICQQARQLERKRHGILS